MGGCDWREIMKKILCFDVGGTFIKYALITENGSILDKGLFPTEAQLGGQYIVDKVKKFTKDYTGTTRDNDQIIGVSVSTAGQVNPTSGVITYAGPTIPDYIGVGWKDELASITGLPVSVENDVNCALLAELGKETSDVTLLVTIGTGIGGALAHEGRVIRGKYFSTGEMGYIPISGTTFQSIASTSALIKRASKISGISNMSGESVFQLAENDEKIAVVISDFYDVLGQGLASASLITGADTLIIGGGITNRKDFTDKVKENVIKYLPVGMIRNIDIKPAVNRNDAGVLGAYRWFKQENPSIIER